MSDDDPSDPMCPPCADPDLPGEGPAAPPRRLPGDPLVNMRHEVFAQGLSHGLSPEAAYREAGYRGFGHGARLARRPEVAARARWLREERDWAKRRSASEGDEAFEARRDMRKRLRHATRAEIVGSLLRLANREDLNGAAGAREARACLLEAFRLGRDLSLEDD